MQKIWQDQSGAMGYIILSEIKSHDVIKIDGPGIEGGCIFKCKSALVHSPTCTNKRINRTIVALHQCLYLPRSSNSYFPPHISRDSPGNTGPLVMRTTKGLLKMRSSWSFQINQQTAEVNLGYNIQYTKGKLYYGISSAQWFITFPRDIQRTRIRQE